MSDCFPILVFVWLKHYNVKWLTNMCSMQYCSKNNNYMIVTKLNKLSSKMASMTIQDNSVDFDT